MGMLNPTFVTFAEQQFRLQQTDRAHPSFETNSACLQLPELPTSYVISEDQS